MFFRSRLGHLSIRRAEKRHSKTKFRPFRRSSVDDGVGLSRRAEENSLCARPSNTKIALGHDFHPEENADGRRSIETSRFDDVALPTSNVVHQPQSFHFGDEISQSIRQFEEETRHEFDFDVVRRSSFDDETAVFSRRRGEKCVAHGPNGDDHLEQTNARDRRRTSSAARETQSSNFEREQRNSTSTHGTFLLRR